MLFREFSFNNKIDSILLRCAPLPGRGRVRGHEVTDSIQDLSKYYLFYLTLLKLNRKLSNKLQSIFVLPEVIPVNFKSRFPL